MIGGKPSILEYPPERLDILIAALENGMYLKHASALAGIDHSTIHKYLQRAKAGDPIAIPLADRINKARAVDIKRCLDIINKAGESAWQAMAWKLERSYNKYYGNNNAIYELNNRLDKLEKIKHEGMSRENANATEEREKE
jgi:hypothetical protein